MFIPYSQLMSARLLHSGDMDGLAEALTDEPADDEPPGPGAPQAARRPGQPRLTCVQSQSEIAA